jgi:hypothetical protein
MTLFLSRCGYKLVCAKPVPESDLAHAPPPEQFCSSIGCRIYQAAQVRRLLQEHDKGLHEQSTLTAPYGVL